MSITAAVSGSTKHLKVLMLPPTRAGADRDFIAGSGSDPFELERLLAGYNIDLTTIGTTGWPINPFGRAHNLLRALDPWRALRVMLRERRYDVVVSVMEGPAAPLLLLRRLVGFTTPIVLWDIAPDDRWRLRTRLQDFVVPRLDGLMVLSSMQPAYIARRWSSRVPVTVIGHHIDTGFYRPADHGSGKDGSGKDGSGNDGSGNDSSGNDASGGGTGDVGGGEYILGVGEDIGRDYATLLAAMQGIPEELVLRTSLALPEAATQLPNLRLMRDRVSEPALRALYAKSRFVVVPLSDTLNASGVSTVLEAGAMGKATIVSASAAMDDFVVDNETCLRVPCHDEAALRAAILRLLNEPETCERLGRNARRFVVENCSRAAFAGRFAAALRAFAARVGYRQSASRSVASRMSASGPQ